MSVKFPDGVKTRQVSELIPYARNARTHSDGQVAQIAASIKEFGFTNPVLVDGDNGIIAGHGRVLAARKLGLDKVPVIELSHLSETQKRAYVLADNKLAEKAGWDNELLSLELGLLAEDGFSMGLIGFSEDELDNFIGEVDPTDSNVKEVATGKVQDEFWISVRGPLPHQSEALQRLQQVMLQLPGLEVELGTVNQDGLGF